MATSKKKLTPLMEQYFQIKQEHADALLLFQVGDFYELFFDDAQRAAAYLGIALTKRGTHQGEPIPLCGVPVHALDFYVTKLVKGGFKVALCNQLEPPVPGTVVKRGVVQVFTPGTLTDDTFLDDKSASYLFSCYPLEDGWGLLFGELLTAQLFATVVTKQALKKVEAELSRFFPDEIIVPDTKLGNVCASTFRKQGYFTTALPENLEHATSFDAWAEHQFRTDDTAALKKYQALHKAAINFYGYLKKNQEAALEQFKSIHFYQTDDYLILDPATQRNLELTRNNQDGGRKSTLLSVLDAAATPMGSRMIKKWLVRPLLRKEPIVQRQQAVGALVGNPILLAKLHKRFKPVGDIERIVGRCALGKARVYDYLGLARAIDALPAVKDALQTSSASLIASIVAKIGTFASLKQLLDAALSDDASSDQIIKKGFDAELDRIRDVAHNSNQEILALEADEQQQTGIGSLKIRYNKVHGYYIEVTKANAKLVPDRYIRQQTLVGRERYITKELKELAADIVHAQQQIKQLEKEIFQRVKDGVAEQIAPLRQTAHALAVCDALAGFAQCAYDNSYVCPTFGDERDIIIQQGRHPVVERMVQQQFIPNDAHLTDQEALWIITGPNMGGKSTYLRQVALICVMAQCGSFVPASSAQLALLDRIFTRIGASDNVAEGKSTFLVEMEETATICNEATKQSLVILDEVGRGTSTFDGLAIAQAVVEHIHTNVKARCLFATHYHELTALQETVQGIVAYYMASSKNKSEIVFLHKIIKGVADGSFGIEVARLAQLPRSVTSRARQVLAQLKQGSHQSAFVPAITAPDQTMLELQQRCDELEEQLEQREAQLTQFQELRQRFVALDSTLE